jgi:hypothetical protein
MKGTQKQLETREEAGEKTRAAKQKVFHHALSFQLEMLRPPENLKQI